VQRPLSRRHVALLPLAASTPAQASQDGSLRRVREAGVVRLGVQVEGTPAASRAPDGSLTGYLPELGRHIAAGLGVRAEFVAVPRGDMLGLSLQGRFDIGLGGAIASTWVALGVLLSDPILQFQLVVLTPRDRPVSGMADLRGARVGVLEGRSFATVVREAGLEEGQLVTHANWQEAAEAMLRGGQEAVIVPGYQAQAMRRVAPLATPRFTLGEFWHCAVLRLGEHDLLRGLNVLLYLLRQEGVLQALHATFFEREIGARRTL
jgi:ABC-type amino acid transport substrate-binding protein